MEEKENEETTSSNNGEMEKKEKKREEEGEEEEAWGTLEELLLVCAVNRHGFNSWDSIAKELQKRIKHSSNNDDKIDVVNDGDNAGDGGGGGTVDSSFSSGNCRKKYVHLKRRFHHEEETASEEAAAAEVTAADGGEEHLMRMVDELRKLRVEELKREVHRHDVSIVSLQLKVKKLEEERENNKVKAEDEEENEEEKTVLLSDLRIKPEENATATGEKGDEPERSSLEKVVTGDSAENRSCNESNSTNHPKTDNTKAGNESKRGEPGAVRVERKRSEPVGGGDNHNHNNNRKVSRLSELGESLSESKRESTRQQSSDVQSSASLSKKKRRRFRGDSGDELEAEEVSPANKRINVKSQPLIRFLETLRSHKHGSVFQRRLPSQETEKYRNVIRQHMDLDTVQSRLDKGIYCDCHPKFYRDLLLTFNNAVLFYRKSTAEHIAARELRRFVMDEIQKTRKPKVQPRKPNLEPQHLEPVVKKPRSSTTMVVCRRRISNSMQPLSDGMKKADTNHTTSTTNSKNNISSNVVNGREEKVKLDHSQKKVNGSNNISSGSLLSKKEKEKDGDENLKKLLTKERSNLGNGGLRLSNSNGKKIISKEGGIKREKTGNVSKDSKQESSEGERAEVMERKKISNSDQKQEKGTPPTPVLKKQGVAKFLKRMKQNSPSSQEKVKNNDSEEDEEEEGGVREKNPNNNKSNARKTGGNLKKSIMKEADVVGTTRRSSGRRGEDVAASRRGIGRPPKRKAAMMSGGTPDSGKSGRSGGRDGSEKFKKKLRR